MGQLLQRAFQSDRVKAFIGWTWPGVWVLVLNGLVGSVALRAADEALPKAEVVLDKYVEVTGGKAAYKKLNNRVSKGSMEFVGRGVKGPTTLYQARPNKFYFAFESDVMGKMESGVNGDLVWEIQPMMGPRIKTGQERSSALREAVFDGEVQWRKLYQKVECVGIATIEDRPCYKVIVTPKEGQPTTQYYDKESNLLVKTEMSVETPMGTIPIESFISDYKKVDGVLIPHKVRQRAAGMEMLFVTDSIKHNVDIPAEKFKVPDTVQALMANDNKEKSDLKPTQAP